jgi:acetylornithine/N-succinyldiaminopimelate aminotransferase
LTTAAPSLTATQQIIDRNDRHLVINLPRYDIAIVKGKGCDIWDASGKRYLDLFAGFGGSILGHCHPDLVHAVTEQANKLWHVGNLLYTEPQTLLAQAIGKHGFDGRSFFSHCGADANEAGIKLARLYGKHHPGKAKTKLGRYKILTAHHSFHGRLFATMMATGQDKVRKGFEPLLDGFSHVPFNDLAAIQNAIDDETVAIMLEPIQGEGGINVPDDHYLPALRKLCDERDILLFMDEVWTGCGRTGKYFAYQHWNFTPDIMTLAKGVGGGLPVGVMCATASLADLYNCKTQGSVKHGTTLGGNCLSMAVAAAVFDVIERDGLLLHAQAMGHHVTQRVKQMAQNVPGIREVRGKGLFLGIELDPAAKGATFQNAAQIVNRCLERGVLTNATQDVVLRIAPPLTITRQQLDEGLDTIEAALRG